jgi:hypothetical protein
VGVCPAQSIDREVSPTLFQPTIEHPHVFVLRVSHPDGFWSKPLHVWRVGIAFPIYSPIRDCESMREMLER